MASRKYRVITFDRPGFGHSAPPPRRTLWTPEAQADLICRALERIGISRATFLGHSWGASVALAAALKRPASATALVLASGYYYPPMRTLLLRLSGATVPILGSVVSYTVIPLVCRLLWPRLVRKLFDPAPVPEKFGGFPEELALRPSQLRASADEIVTPGAFALHRRCASLKTPLVIVAGDRDRLVNTNEQSARLNREVRHSSFWRVPNTGHMVHQTATGRVMEAIDEAVSRGREQQTPGGGDAN